MKRYLSIFCLLILIGNFAYTQKAFTHQDTLRGSITEERAWWDVVYYHLNVNVNIQNKTLSGRNLIRYKVLNQHQILQIELQQPLTISRVLQDGKALTFQQDGYSYFITLLKKQTVGSINELTVFYEGKPQESKNPPWSGGLTWEKDSAGNDWVVTTSQGDGASLWWPNKDHAYDEPDSMQISITAPKHLTAIANGKLKGIVNNPTSKTYHWMVSNPINNYGVNMNIGNYVHYGETYQGLKGNLNCSYYVLEGNLIKAKKQFKEVPKMLAAFEHWFGPYPFYEDGYKLVEVPYAGMEHQSSVTYGNGFENGYLGKDVSGTGWGMKFDFIIVHESGHEWFANSITHQDVADMWIHESFTSHAESLFLAYYFGEQACNAYVIGTRKNILNDKPIIGTYNVHNEGSADMYYKGSNVLHMLRKLVDDDAKWRSILSGLNQTFYHQTVTSKQIEDYLSEHTGLNLTPFFDQYLRTVKIPVLAYKIKDDEMKYCYQHVVSGFDFPVKIKVAKKTTWIYPKTEWQTLKTTQKITFDPNFYIDYKQVMD